MADLKQVARQIFRETLAAIDIRAAMQRKLSLSESCLHCSGVNLDLRAFDKILVVAIGKAAHAMLEGLAALLPDTLPITGVVAAPTPPSRALQGLRYFLAGHPIPNQASCLAAQAILDLLQQCDARTLVFFLLSGGGSALVELPLAPDANLSDLQQLYGVLVTCGAPIADLGIIRRHLSAVKGGRLALAAGPATKLTLAVSDVPVGKESSLASGPTLPDTSTWKDVHRVFQQYQLGSKLTPAFVRWIESSAAMETPKENNPAFANAYFSLLLGMDDLFHPAHHAAEGKGCIACCDNSTDDWPLREAADSLLAQLEELRAANPGHRVALIADGEVSSPVSGPGVGGRNSAFVLACVERIAGHTITVLSGGTDGIDGNSPAAGAVADGATLARAQAAGMHPTDFFARSDAYTFFDRLGDTIVTGPTGNNLRDLRILIGGPATA